MSMSIWIIAVMPMCGATAEVFPHAARRPMVSVMPGAVGVPAVPVRKPGQDLVRIPRPPAVGQLVVAALPIANIVVRSMENGPVGECVPGVTKRELVQTPLHYVVEHVQVPPVRVVWYFHGGR